MSVEKHQESGAVCDCVNYSDSGGIGLVRVDAFIFNGGVYIMNKVIILSAELSTLDKDTNAQRTAQLRQLLEDNELPYIQAIGSYQGVEETSFIVVVNEPQARSMVIEMGQMFNQECVLSKDVDGQCSLLYPDREESIGRMIAVPKERALKHEAWTYNPVTNTYFIVV